MTTRTLPELKADILGYLDTARTVDEVVQHVREDRTLVTNLMTRMAGDRLIMIAPGTCGKCWTTRVKAEKILEGGSDE